MERIFTIEEEVEIVQENEIIILEKGDRIEVIPLKRRKVDKE